VLIAFAITPLGIGEEVGEVVAEAIRVVRASGLPNHTDAMFTTIEGEWDEAMAVLKADHRPGVTGAITAKVERVEAYLSTK
jgi:uncharacterized protein YqgV (UPF0045/DUF77 family)